MVDVICNPLCIEHDVIRPCPICDKEKYKEEQELEFF